MVEAGVIGQGSVETTLTESDVCGLLREAFSDKEVKDKRLLVIIPDGTRTAPIPLMFRLLYEQLGEAIKRLDYLIALGTHQPMSDSAIDKLVGISEETRAETFPKSEVYNHRWDLPDTLREVGVTSSFEMHRLTDGYVDRETPSWRRANSSPELYLSASTSKFCARPTRRRIR